MKNPFPRAKPDVRKDVAAFHKKFDLPCPPKPTIPQKDWAKFRIERIREETQELITAIEDGDLLAIANEAIDMIYVAVGTLVDYGLPFRAVWNAVQAANMDKHTNPNGGKPLKHKTWESPKPKIEKAVLTQMVRYGGVRVVLLIAVIASLLMGCSTYTPRSIARASTLTIDPSVMLIRTDVDYVERNLAETRARRLLTFDNLGRKVRHHEYQNRCNIHFRNCPLNHDSRGRH